MRRGDDLHYAATIRREPGGLSATTLNASVLTGAIAGVPPIHFAGARRVPQGLPQ